MIRTWDTASRFFPRDTGHRVPRSSPSQAYPKGPLASHRCAVAVVGAFMSRVMAGLAKDQTVIDRTCATELNMSDVVRDSTR